MLRRSFTAVIEKNATFTESFETEPYEAGWASEARWFARVLEMTPATTLRLKPEISPDGLFWCDEGSAGVEIESPGLYSFALRDFGCWLRLNGDLKSADESGTPSVKLILYLALKE